MEQTNYEVDEKNRWRLETPGHEGWKRTARPGDPQQYLMISADCHANEPGSLWRERLDAKYRDRLPHVEVDAKGEKWFVAEGLGKSRVRARMIDNVPRENSEDRLRGNAGADPVERIQDHIPRRHRCRNHFPQQGAHDVRHQGRRRSEWRSARCGTISRGRCTASTTTSCRPPRRS